MTTPTTSPASDVDRGTGLVARVASELHLPLLGKGVLQSFRPTHLMLGFLAALVVFGGAWMLDRAWIGVFDAERTPFGVLGAFWPTGGPAMFESRMQAFARSLESQTFGVALVLALAVLIASLFLGAIGRSAALDMCANRRAGLFASLRFAVRRVVALLGAVGIPLVAIGLALGLIKLFGLLLFSAGFTQPIGGVLFVVPLLIGLIVSIIAIAFALFHCMLAPATAIDEADAIDAIQRAAGYLLGRPIRFALYVVLLVILLNYAYALVQTTCRVAIGFADGALPDAGLEKTDAAFTRDAIGFWVQILWLVFIGWVISLYGTASTVLYLIMREACDGQDVSVVEMKDA